ncbi:hypothetical protein [Rubritalea tangerina]|uniref:hypothetical protein n=1 Tax=Rubritalea tangerina TaxID=430798 RepID=UPI003618BF24
MGRSRIQRASGEEVNHSPNQPAAMPTQGMVVSFSTTEELNHRFRRLFRLFPIRPTSTPHPNSIKY